jgi:hypothetical protein
MICTGQPFYGVKFWSNDEQKLCHNPNWAEVVEATSTGLLYSKTLIGIRGMKAVPCGDSAIIECESKA